MHARHPHRAFGTVVLDCIGEQIDDDLAQPDRIGRHHGIARIATIENHPDSRIGRQWRHHRQALVDDDLHRHRRDRELQLTGLDAAELDQVVDQRQQMASGTLDFRSVVAGLV